MSNSGFLRRLQRQLTELQLTRQLRPRHVSERLDSTRLIRNGRVLVNFSSNDYLGLSHHPEVRHALEVGAQKLAGSGASPLITGRSPSQEALEDEICEMEHVDSCVVFPTGFAANFGTLNALIRNKDAVFCDRENHASLIDGCRGSSGTFFVYDRNYPDVLRKSLSRRRHEYESVFIVTDSIFSMDGAACDLRAVCDVAERWDCVVVVDEAHATGVFGKNGSGLCEELGASHRVDVRTGTLSKAIGCLGGFACGTRELSDWLWNAGRSQFFSTALPPALCDAACCAVRILRSDHGRRERLHQNAIFARASLRQAGIQLVGEDRPSDGWTVLPETSPIAGITMQSADDALWVAAELELAGFLMPAIRSPTVPGNSPRLRMSITSEHTREEIAAAVTTLRDLLDRVPTAVPV